MSQTEPVGNISDMNDMIRIPLSLYEEKITRISELKHTLKHAEGLAGTLQFIIRMRALVEEFEDNVASYYFVDDENYEAWVMQMFGEGAPELRYGIHCRKWTRVLHVGNPNDCWQLTRVLTELGKNTSPVDEFRDRCHTFALGIQGLLKFFSNELPCPLLMPNTSIFIDPAKIEDYISILSPTIRDAVRIFHKSSI